MSRVAGLLSEDDETVRTQITLTNQLKRLIENKALIKGQSLSEYLRRAALVSLVLEEDEKDGRERLADLVIGAVDLKKHPDWKTAKKVRKWVRNFRKEWR